MRKTYIPAPLRRQVYADFEERCAYCGNPERLMDGIYQIDHIEPEASGGPTERDNLCLTCPLCNTFKGARTTGVDPQTGQRMKIFHPRQQKWERHFEWSVDGMTILGRTRSGRATERLLLREYTVSNVI